MLLDHVDAAEARRRLGLGVGGRSDLACGLARGLILGPARGLVAGGLGRAVEMALAAVSGEGVGVDRAARVGGAVRAVSGVPGRRVVLVAVTGDTFSLSSPAGCLARAPAKFGLALYGCCRTDFYRGIFGKHGGSHDVSDNDGTLPPCGSIMTPQVLGYSLAVNEPDRLSS